MYRQELLQFTQGLDFGRYIKDAEVQSMIDQVKRRILELEGQPEVDEEGPEDDKDGSGDRDLGQDNDPLDEAEIRMQVWKQIAQKAGEGRYSCISSRISKSGHRQLNGVLDTRTASRLELDRTVRYTHPPATGDVHTPPTSLSAHPSAEGIAVAVTKIDTILQQGSPDLI